MSKGRILIVEDEMIVARDLQLALVRMGYSTPAIAISGKPALKSVAKVRPDLVLMDIVLKGGRDGRDRDRPATDGRGRRPHRVRDRALGSRHLCPGPTHQAVRVHPQAL